MSDATSQLFSIDPDPPEQGKPLKVTYTGSPVEATITFTPPGTAIAMSSSPMTVDVPDEAIAFIIHDNTGQSIDLAGAVDPQ